MQVQMKANWDVVTRRLRVTEDIVITAIQKAIDFTAQDLVKFNQNLMEQSFDGVTQFTRNGFFWRGTRATGELKGGIYGREFAAKGTPAYKYLMPNIKGGPRRYKRHEKLLRQEGKLTGGMMTVPGRAAKLDQYGNISGSTYTRLLAEVNALNTNDPYTRALKGKSKPRKKKGAGRYFIMYKAGRPIGVGERDGNGKSLGLVLMFVNPSNYKKIYPFYEGNAAYVRQEFPRKFYRLLRAEIRKYR